ncbi:exodeoxyribonuclease V subunit beta [Bacteroides helcogenes]|uniref:DNA 3'-5' helicase n=1 Tax=Bacteroides helcogenes (strain ATCC 35417 / DSM 20613 / JCM 6297 / CCUG 15421 / P 36-108) TaxID=693979 RepID=E6SVA6_BACT6|nr:UvrD-helicase domain-containing protein [Bacteroides helcogenes]ADV44472.1 UvrD/REP helicase [Bacteroides helcogenes P 36-108]MDY5237122.1 UvrD-helicase domain-containing protein [Bacteroides helcogenes]
MELLVYKASAGSGKTFTLAVEYIKHLIQNPHAYRQILAVTFTNKATAEMKERILQQLYGIWKGDPASDAYLSRIKEDLGKRKDNLSETEVISPFTAGSEDEELRKRAGMALQYMLHDYSRFRVETIDSFFQSVMRNLARELELSPNLNIELNNTEVLSDAVDSLIEKLTATSPVLAWLLEYINERIADDKRWNVSNEVKGFGRNIFDESYMERGEKLRQCLRDPDALKLYREVLRDMETEALEQMKAFYDQFEGELEGHNLTPEDLKGGTRGIGSYFRKLRDGKLTDKDVITVTLQNSLADAKNWATKTSRRRDDIVRLAETSLLPLLQDAERLRPQKSRTLNSCRLSLQHLNKLRLLNHIDEEVRTLNREHNRFLLSDTSALLHKLVREGDSSFVFEKIGANIRNVMIDEFQDTSRMQWDNFRLLLLEGLSQGADSLIVGDVKQSIYRWRNGDWGILNSLGNDDETTPGYGQAMKNGGLPSHFPVRVETLKTNRRSETRIIRFNNALFTLAANYLNTLYLDELKKECYPLKRAYADVAQESPKTKERGYIKASFLSPDEEHNYTEQTLAAMGKQVRELLDAGVRPDDITILVRKNKNIPPIADYFDKELRLAVVSDEAFRLDASQAVCMLMDALRYLSNPENIIAKASLIVGYQTIFSPQATPAEAMQPQAILSDEMLPPAFTSRMETLRLMPLYELLEELFGIFGMSRVEKQDAYLFSFFDAVTEYLQNNSSEPDSFIRFWEETLCAKTIPGGETDGIRILSIHKSKGLEFHTVLVPFCDWKLENETNNQLVWCTAPEAPYNAINLIPVSYSATMAESVYQEDYLRERLQLWVDNLNLLYVALTRAGKNLILWSKKDQKGTMAELLAHTLPQMAHTGTGGWNEEQSVYEDGQPCPSATKAPATASPTFINKLTQKPAKLPVHMESMLHDIEFRQSNRSADFIAGVDEEQSDQRFINRGRLLHTLFSDIETEADIDDAISRLVFEGIIGHTETEQQIRELTRRAFTQPMVKDWYSGSWQLFNECDIIWQEEGELRTRRPDRVMMKDGETVVVDFKFGKPDKKYNKQVQGYMQLLACMGYAPQKIRGYLWYVEEGSVEEVRAAV